MISSPLIDTAGDATQNRPQAIRPTVSIMASRTLLELKQCMVVQ